MPIQEAPYLISPNGEKSLAFTLLKYQNPNIFTWEPNTPFDATLEIEGLSRSGVLVRDIGTGIKYNILNSYLIELIKADALRNAQVVGRWVVYKHGQSFGVKLV